MTPARFLIGHENFFASLLAIILHTEIQIQHAHQEKAKFSSFNTKKVILKVILASEFKFRPEIWHTN